MSGPVPDVARIIQRQRRIAERFAYREGLRLQQLQQRSRLPLDLIPGGPTREAGTSTRNRLSPGQPANRSLLAWWLAKHDRNSELTAVVSGVSAQTVRRWKRLKSIPLEIACLLEQLQQGPAIKAGLFRGEWVARPEWRDDVRATGVFDKEAITW